MISTRFTDPYTRFKTRSSDGVGALIQIGTEIAETRYRKCVRWGNGFHHLGEVVAIVNWGREG